VTGALKVGLLGAGYILDAHAKALAATPGVKLQAVCDLSRDRARRAATRFNIPEVLTSLEELASSECAVVHVLLPPPLHIESATTLVEAGKSVFLEKPMGLDSKACDALCVRAAERRVSLGVNNNFLFSRGYEWLRASVKNGELGRIDHLAVNWHFPLPLVKFGPFDSWMLAAPANIMFELGCHLGAFIVDLIGVPKIASAIVGNPILLPGGATVYRQWTAVGASGKSTVLLSLSIGPAHADRFLRVRASGGSVQLDFGRDIVWRDVSVADNPIFDSYGIAHSAGRALLRQASHDRNRRLRAALAKRPDANPFEESVFRSIRAFYAHGLQQLDRRHCGSLAGDVVRLCESVTRAAGVDQPISVRSSIPSTKPKVTPALLIVGGTGFIGRRLVRALVERGQAVRVLTRNPAAAAVEFAELPVDICGGSHGDPECAKRALDGIKFVYHLAKCEGKRWQDYVENDIQPTLVLAEAALAAHVERFIYTGTIASCATASARDVVKSNTPIDVAIDRRSHYARSKAACEVILQSLHGEHGLPLVILRPGIVIGPGSPPWHPGVGRFLNETRVDYWGDGRSMLPLVVVDDVVDALLRAMTAQGVDGQALLLTSPPLMTARDYVGALSTHMRARIDARSSSLIRMWAMDVVKEALKYAVQHPNRHWPSLHDWRCASNSARYDSELTQQVLGWRPIADRETMVHRGIVDAVDWILS
jgi:nucleoside-diphosphate-sugar epimerase/predicted dehydrogenase